MRSIFWGLLVLVSLTSLLHADAAPSYSLTRIKKPSGSATSVLKEAKRSYPAGHAADGRLDTAWCEGNNGHGEGESITLKFPPAAGNGVAVFNGIGTTKKLYQANNRIKDYEAVVTFTNGRSETVKGTFQENCGWGDERECYLGDDNSKEEQRCIERLKLQCYFNDYNQQNRIQLSRFACIEKVKLTIRSVYPGTKYSDTCISEMAVSVPVDAIYGMSDAQKKKMAEIINSCK